MKDNIIIDQRVGIVVDGNNLERSANSKYGDETRKVRPDMDAIISKLLRNRKLTSLSYYREGDVISSKFSRRLRDNYFGITEACGKSADVPIAIRCTELINRVDTIIIVSGDIDFLYLIRHLKSRGIRVEIGAFKHCINNKLYDEVDAYTHFDENDIYPLTKTNG